MKIMVLSDGETFSSLEGCTIAEVPDWWDLEQIEEAIEDLNPTKSRVKKINIIVRTYTDGNNDTR